MRRRYVVRDGELVEVSLDYAAEPRVEAASVMGDIQPYRSMIDGSMISSRSRHREHLKAHNCVEVGNDSSIKNVAPRPIAPPPGRKEHIIRAANEVKERLRRR